MWRYQQLASGVAININWLAPTWVKLVQITARWSAVPVAVENFQLIKDHAGTGLDVALITFDPATLAIINYDNEQVYWFEPGETIKVSYANTNARNILVDLYIRQVFQ